MILKKIALMLWIIAGITVIIEGSPNLLAYILCWCNLLLVIIVDIRRDYQ